MRIHEDCRGGLLWGRHPGTALMYRMYGMPISPIAPTLGAGAKIGYVQDVRYADFAGAKISDAAIAKKTIFMGTLIPGNSNRI